MIELAGYDWLEADNFRKGVGKKIPAVLEEQHVRFVQGCIEHSGLTKEKAEELWNLIVPFRLMALIKLTLVIMEWWLIGQPI